MSEHSLTIDKTDDSSEEFSDYNEDIDDYCELSDSAVDFKNDDELTSSYGMYKCTEYRNPYSEEVYDFMNWVFYSHDLNTIHSNAKVKSISSQLFYDTLKHFYNLPENESHDKQSNDSQLEIKMLDNRSKFSTVPSDNFAFGEIKHLNLLYRRYGKKETDERNRIFGLFANAHTIDELNCNIELLTETSNEYKIIHHYVINSGENYFVKHIFKIERKTECESFKQFETCKRMLLFHGTPIYNCHGIMLYGLKTGVRDGIFFADMPQKSYSYSQKFNGYFSGKCYNYVILFVADVAVGNIDGTGLPKGFSCVLYKGNQSRDSSDMTTIDNAIVPYGKLNSCQTGRNAYQYNEYLVNKPELVKLKYLVVFRKI